MSWGRPQKKSVLDLGGSDDEEGPSFSVNKDYADRYDRWRGKEELQKLKDRYGDVGQDDEVESSSSSSSEEEWSEEQEKDFLKTFSLLKKKDPKIYDSATFFFKHEDKEKTADGGESKIEPATSLKPSKKLEKVTIKDHERKMILEKGTLDSDDEADVRSKVEDKDPSYVQIQANIKKGFQDALNSIESDDEGDNYNKSDLLSKREKRVEEKEKDDEDYRKWLKGEVERLKTNDGSVKDMTFLKEYWNDPKLNEGEKFLRDYILNRKYMDPLKDERVPSYNEIVRDSDEEVLKEDEKALEEMEQFEHKYNFRFEEPDQEFIKRYPRTIASSLRRQDDKRKKHRDSVKERKEAEKQKKRDEIQRLKALKKQEIMEKIKQVQESVGDPELAIEEMDIEGDFDPEEHDRRMQKIFSDNYYGQDEEEKPVFPFDEDIDGDLADIKPYCPTDEEAEDDVVIKDENEPKQNGPSTSKASQAAVEKASRTQALIEELIESSNPKRKHGKKKSIFLEALERSKPAFDPKTHGSFERYFEEYYNLHYEDIIGDTPCRFKYRQVPANDFGLTVDEILKAPDRELNQWASLKKTYQYRPVDEEKYEIDTYKRKASNLKQKQKILSSLFKTAEDDEESEDHVDENSVISNEPHTAQQSETTGQKKKKKKKKKKKTKANQNGVAPVVVESVVTEEVKSSPVQEDDTGKEKNKKKNKKRATGERPQEAVEVQKRDAISSSVVAPTESGPSSNPSEKKSNKNKRKKPSENNQEDRVLPKKHKSNHKPENNGIEDDRLLAYGINPKKFRKQQKYGVKK